MMKNVDVGALNEAAEMVRMEISLISMKELMNPSDELKLMAVAFQALQGAMAKIKGNERDASEWIKVLKESVESL